MSVVSAEGVDFPATVPVLIVGAGACGLTAALAAREAGAGEVVVLEREATPFGSTSLSAGLIPASGTRFQRQRDVEDSAEQQAADILVKCNGQADPDMVRHVAGLSGQTIEWLADSCGVPFDTGGGLHLSGAFGAAHARPAGPQRRRIAGMPGAGGDAERRASDDRCDCGDPVPLRRRPRRRRRTGAARRQP